MRSVFTLSVLLLLGGTIATQAIPQAPKRGAAVQTAHERLLPLQGGLNFRDMGGYRTRDGRQVRWGKLYRSGEMSNLTVADYAYLNRLGIRSVCDLRSVNERKSAPMPWKGAHDYWTSDLADSGDMRALFAGGGERTAETFRAAMTDMYRTLPVAQKDAYAHIFRELVAGRVPLAFNCTAGKDRTGVAAALILSALGVPRATVVQDYLLTNKLADFSKLPQPEVLANLPPATVAPLSVADKVYIDAMFETIDKRYGSVEGYLRKELGIGPAQLRTIRARLLT